MFSVALALGFPSFDAHLAIDWFFSVSWMSWRFHGVFSWLTFVLPSLLQVSHPLQAQMVCSLLNPQSFSFDSVLPLQVSTLGFLSTSFSFLDLSYSVSSSLVICFVPNRELLFGFFGHIYNHLWILWDFLTLSHWMPLLVVWLIDFGVVLFGFLVFLCWENMTDLDEFFLTICFFILSTWSVQVGLRCIWDV